MLFPLIRTGDAVTLVQLALPELRWLPASLQAVPPQARRRYYTQPVLIGLLLTGPPVLLPGWWACLAVLPLPLAWLVGRGQAHDAGWSIDDSTVTFRWRRVLARHTLVCARTRVQLTEVTRTPWQRRAGLSGARLTLSTRRRARLRHLEAADALLLLHEVGRRSGRTRPPTYRGK